MKSLVTASPGRIMRIGAVKAGAKSTLASWPTNSDDRASALHTAGSSGPEVGGSKGSGAQAARDRKTAAGTVWKGV